MADRQCIEYKTGNVVKAILTSFLQGVIERTICNGLPADENFHRPIGIRPADFTFIWLFINFSYKEKTSFRYLATVESSYAFPNRSGFLLLTLIIVIFAAVAYLSWCLLRYCWCWHCCMVAVLSISAKIGLVFYPVLFDLKVGHPFRFSDSA